MRVRELCAQPRRRSAGADSGDRLSNIVFMGIGEPLANYDNVLEAIRIINADWGMNIGARKITVSTVGLPKQIRQLADEDLQINLAISLHAPTDALRRQLIPWAKQVSIDELVGAVGTTSRRPAARSRWSTSCSAGSTTGRSTPPIWPTSAGGCGATST